MRINYQHVLEVRKEPSDAYILVILLPLVGGFLDVYTYIGRGHVFANAQTGNIILMAIHFADANYNRVIHYLIPILCFMGGVVISEMIRMRYQYSNIHWRQIIILFEICTLLFMAFYPYN